MGPCVRRDDTLKHRAETNTPSHSRGAMRPSFAFSFRPQEIRGRRESRVRAAPAVSCAIECTWRTRAYRSSGEHPAFPAQWCYGLYAISPVSRALLPPSLLRNLFLKSFAPASGARTTRFRRTLEPRASVAALASTAPRPTFVTIASAPLNGTGWPII